MAVQTETFYGNQNETFYVDQFNRIWLIQSVDFAEDADAQLQTELPAGLAELSSSIAHDLEFSENVYELPESAKAEVVKSARADAQIFVDEFGEPLDPSATDWDGEGFANECGKWSFNLDDSRTYEAAWELYQSELVAETEKLSA